jgi:DNA-binding transcriptional MerR regulator
LRDAKLIAPVGAKRKKIMNAFSAGALSAMPDVSNDNLEDNDDLTRIGDMARLYGVTLRALRFYEDKGLIQPVRQGTTRLYTRRDQARLKLILRGRKIGFSLREVKQMLDLYDPAGSNVRQFRVALEKSERQLSRLERQRRTLDESISDLKELMGEINGKLVDRNAPTRA